MPCLMKDIERKIITITDTQIQLRTMNSKTQIKQIGHLDYLSKVRLLNSK